MVLRRIPSQFLTFEQIGMPDAIRVADRPAPRPAPGHRPDRLRQDDEPGVSMINFINENYDRHIITLEDPIEYYHKHKKCTVNQREIGVDVPDFTEGIRRALRMDPDIILVGEMRDLETIHAAIEAAETGHIVFGTLHTSGAASARSTASSTSSRKDQQDQIRTQLSTALIGVLSQALLPQEARGPGRRLRDDGGDARHPEPDPREQDVPHRLGIQTGRKHGMFLLDESLFHLWKDGLVREGRGPAEVEQAGRAGRQDRPGRAGLSTTTRTRRTRTRTRTRTTTTTRTRTTAAERPARSDE